jgi:hypothetical protein
MKVTRAAKAYKKRWLTRFANPRASRKLRTTKMGKGFAKRVKAVIQKTAEHKILGLITGNTAATLNTQALASLSVDVNSFPNWTAASSTILLPTASNYTWLYPQVEQGTDKQSRIGNKITCLFAKCRIKFSQFQYVGGNTVGPGTVPETSIWVHEIVAPKGQFGDQGAGLVNNVGSFMYKFWGTTNSVLGNFTLQNLSRPKPEVDSTYTGLYIRRSHRVPVPSIMPTSDNVTNDLVTGLAHPPRFVTIKSAKKTLRYEANADELPSNTNILIVIVNNTYFKAPYDINSYMSFIDE